MGVVREAWDGGGADLEWSGDGRRLKVVRVRETWLKGRSRGQTLDFWVLSQDPSLDALSLRELAHLRWFIENKGFEGAQ